MPFPSLGLRRMKERVSSYIIFELRFFFLLKSFFFTERLLYHPLVLIFCFFLDRICEFIFVWMLGVGCVAEGMNESHVDSASGWESDPCG